MPDLVSIHARTYKLQRILHNKLDYLPVTLSKLSTEAEYPGHNATAEGMIWTSLVSPRETCHIPSHVFHQSKRCK